MFELRIAEEGELPHFTVEFNENHSKFVDLDPIKISYKMIVDKLKNLNPNKAVALIICIHFCSNTVLKLLLFL